MIQLPTTELSMLILKTMDDSSSGDSTNTNSRSRLPRVHLFFIYYVSWVDKTITKIRMQKGPNCVMTADHDRNRARKKTKKHSLTMFHLLIE
jgi:hypothetical protein